MKRVLLLAFGAVAFACGGTTNPSDDAGADAPQDAPRDTAQDVAPDTSGPLTCGTTTCDGTDLCVHPCCGGAPPQCVPLQDGGTCPTGYTPSSQCYNLGSSIEGCVPPPCTPPPPYCTPASSGACPTYDQVSGRNCYEFCA